MGSPAPDMGQTRLSLPMGPPADDASTERLIEGTLAFERTHA